MKMEWEQFKKADSFNFGKTITVTLGATSETTLSSASVELKGGASASAKLGGAYLSVAFPTILKLDVNLGSALKKKSDGWEGNLFHVEKKTASAKVKEKDTESAMSEVETVLVKAQRAETAAENAGVKLVNSVANIIL